MPTDETTRVLQMIADGRISAEEGATLLDALAQSSPTDDASSATEVVTSPPYSHPKPAWANLWGIPLAGGILIAAFAINAILGILTGTIAWGWIILALPSMAIGLLIALFGGLMWRSPWLCLRVRDASSKFSIALPLPLSWIGGLVKIARKFIPKLAHIISDDLVEMLSTSIDAGFSLEVNEETGEKVSIFYG